MIDYSNIQKGLCTALLLGACFLQGELIMLAWIVTRWLERHP